MSWHNVTLRHSNISQLSPDGNGVSADDNGVSADDNQACARDYGTHSLRSVSSQMGQAYVRGNQACARGQAPSLFLRLEGGGRISIWPPKDGARG